MSEELISKIRTGETIVKETSIKDPMEISPIILDHHTSRDLKAIEKLLPYAKSVSDRPFKTASKSLIELRNNTQHIPSSEKKLIDMFVNRLLSQVIDIKEDEIRVVVETTTIAADWTEFVNRLHAHANSPEILEEESKWIWDPPTQSLSKLIGPEAYQLMLTSRLIGLVPLSATDHLRSLKIKNAGGSAVAKTLFLLAEMGATDIEFWDPACFDGADIARQPGGAADFQNIGRSKANSLQQVMNGVNPYANFIGHPGKVVATEGEKMGKFDVSFDQFVDGAGLLGEVTEDVKVKAGLRTYLQEHFAKSNLLYVADVAHGFAGIERFDLKPNLFNNGISIKEAEHMIQNPGEKIRSFVFMLGKEKFPLEHQLQFLHIATGMMPYLAQMPVSANESSSVAYRLIMGWIMNRDVLGKNYSPSDVPSTLMPQFDSRCVEILEKIMNQVFNLELNSSSVS